MKNVLNMLIIVLLTVSVFSCKTPVKIAEIEAPEEISNPVAEQSPEEEPRYTIKITGRYPVIDTLPDLSANIRNYAVGLYRDVENEIRENDKAARAAGNTDFAKTEFSYNVSWKAGRDDKQFCSILLDIQWYAGGAHGVEHLESFNWDMQSGKLMALPDVMPLTGYTELSELAKYVQTELTKKLAFSYEEDENIFAMIQDGTTPDEENFRVFLVERDGVTFYFQRYAVAPGAAGVQSVKVPFKR